MVLIIIIKTYLHSVHGLFIITERWSQWALPNKLSHHISLMHISFLSLSHPPCLSFSLFSILFFSSSLYLSLSLSLSLSLFISLACHRILCNLFEYTWIPVYQVYIIIIGDIHVSANITAEEGDVGWEKC